MGCLPQCPCLYSFTQNSLQMGFIWTSLTKYI
jgi:ascorbate-specific PTS system EIIC-type component UlaA